MAKTYRQPKPPKSGRAQFITEVQKCNTDTSRTTILPLVKRAIADFNLPPGLITPHVHATWGTVRNWLTGKSTPNVYSRNDLKIVLLKFLRGQDLGPPEEDFRALRQAFKKPDAYLRENFDPLLNEAHRLFGNKLFSAASEAGVSYALLTNWMEGADSLPSTRQMVISYIDKKLLWRF